MFDKCSVRSYDFSFVRWLPRYFSDSETIWRLPVSLRAEQHTNVACLRTIIVSFNIIIY